MDGQQGSTAPWAETTIVGRRVARVDAHERVGGTAHFTIDISLPGLLHAVIVRCPHPHARLTRIDAARARSMPGVRAILTTSDPEARLPWHYGFDGKPQSTLLDPHCRFAGEEVAAVAADTVYQAFDAALIIEAEYETLPFVTGVDDALQPGAPQVHPGGNLAIPPIRYSRGDVEEAMARADAIVEGTWRTACQLHTPMEAHGSVAEWDGGHLTVWDTTQSVYDVQQALADRLSLPLSHVRVISSYMGGGFGSKLEVGKYTVIAALLSKKAGRPVKLFLTREEGFVAAGNRPANAITVKAGAARDGTLLALDVRARGSIGAYQYATVTGDLFQSLYRCPHVRTEDLSVYTNTGRACAFRAPDHPPAAWALEQTMDMLAARLGLDPVAFRLKNMSTVHQRRKLPYTSIGLPECLTEGARAFGWDAARSRPRTGGHLRRGVGVAAAMWNYPGEPVATVIARMDADGSVTLVFGAADIGTGTKTVMAMVAAEELRIRVEEIGIEHADSGVAPYAVASGGSQTVLVNAPAVRDAASVLAKQVLDLAASQLKVAAGDLFLEGGEIRSARDAAVRLRFRDLDALKAQRVLVATGHRAPAMEGKIALPFAAHFAEVEVDTHTGEVRVLRLLGAHDSGRVMNLNTYENQVFGGMTMGVGFGMTEERVVDRATGRVLTTGWADYHVPTALDVPAEVACVPIDPHDAECNSVGAKGLGEPATIPTAAAIANAVADACGVRIATAPMTPATVLEALRRG